MQLEMGDKGKRAYGSLGDTYATYMWCGARQCGTLSNTAPAPPLVFFVPKATYDELEEMPQPATTQKKPAKHRDHGGRAALLSSDVELMVRHIRTCGRPVHGVGRGRGRRIYVANLKL